jgi:hypothetical protein
MKRAFISLTAFLAGCVGAANATTITFSGAPTARTVVDSSSQTLAQGDLVLAGTFSNTSFSLNSSLSLADNLASVVSSGVWKQFTFDPTTGLLDSGITNRLAINSNGKAGGVVADINIPQADYFDGKQGYLMIFNASTVASATQMGIFTATSASTPWVFPTNQGGGPGDAFTWSSGSVATPTMVAIGGFGSTSSSQLTLTNNFAAVPPVPEPSTFSFGLLAGLVAIFPRMRRKGV